MREEMSTCDSIQIRLDSISEDSDFSNSQNFHRRRSSVLFEQQLEIFAEANYFVNRVNQSSKQETENRQQRIPLFTNVDSEQDGSCCTDKEQRNSTVIKGCCEAARADAC
jgi:hypothetical protein